tara:strand:- start:3383 stop:5530 length:2148 start_codon:yes stop_codon:yes gene_type:complete
MGKKHKSRNELRAIGRRLRASMKTGRDISIESSEAVEFKAAESVEGEEQSTPRFRMVAYSGAPMSPGGWTESEPLVLDLKGMEVGSASIPIHRDHDRTRVVGHSQGVDVKDNRLIVHGSISAANEHAHEVVASSKNNFPWQASVGANLNRAPQYVAEDKTVVVNGRRMAGPLFVAKSWTLKEASFVSLGADSRTSGVAAGDNQMSKFQTWLEAKGFELDELSDEQVTLLQASFDNDTAEEEAEVVTDLAALDESQDVDADIAALAESRAEFYARSAAVEEHLSSHPQLAAKAITDGWGEDKIKLEALRASYSRGPAIHVESDQMPASSAIEARMLMNDGWTGDDCLAHYEPKQVEAAEKLPEGAGLQYLCHQVIRASGGHSSPGAFGNDTIRAAFNADRQIQAAGGFSTISLSGTLSNLANKALLAAYNETPSVFRTFARIASHNDFKSHTKYRVTTPGLLDEIGPTGEVKHTELDEDTYTNEVDTFARMMALTRQMLINDDLNQFLQIPSMFGRMAARTLERSVFTTLLDNTDSFFNASASLSADGHLPNALSSGSSSALSSSSLGSAEALFWGQTDKHGNPIDLAPSVLLTSHNQYRDAKNLLEMTTVNVVGDPTSAEQLRVSNEYFGEFRPVRSPYVNNSGISGASATQWWLFAAPTADVAAVEVAFLRGRQVPVIENAETDFNTLGMQWRAYHDWGVAKQDPRAGVYSPGA